MCRYTTLWNIRRRTQAGDSNAVAWSTLIEAAMWSPNSPDVNKRFGMFFNKWPINSDDSRQSASWSRRSSLSGANCSSVWLIAPLVSGVAVLNASSSSKTNTLNIWRKTVRYDFLDNNWDNKHVVSVVNFLKCVVAEVVLFLFVIVKTLTFHKVV